MEALRFPIGRFEKQDRLTDEERALALDALEEAPGRLREAVAGLTDEQLDTPYRDGGWTVRQVVAHVPDSHLNAYVRFRWALTETDPTIKAYDQKAWAELPDARGGDPELSLALLDAVHARLLELLRSLEPGDFGRAWIHPEGWRGTVDTLVALYAWHGRHHTAHITGLREREGW